MGIGINDFRIAIRIDNAEAKQKLVETKDVISVLRNELSKMETDGKKDTAVYIEKKAALDKLNNEYKEHKKVVGLTGLTYDELRKGARTLKVQMDRSIPNSEKWLSYQRDLNLVEERLKILRGQVDSTEMSLSKFSSGFNKYAAIGASVIASLTGITLTARKCVDEFAQMQEAESQVRKYTGMTSEQVAGLNEEFKKMDTRTARERLNELAGDAGRLGITAKNEVLEFVEAANMIDVALGEDLGQDAIKNIGKLADMFGDSERSMKENMLAIGSAVNEVAQNSSAAEPYLVEFSARMGGVAKQAKLSITDVMGFASALDQNMLRSEMASTALQGLILKLYQEPAKYAKIARVDVKQFTTLMETDANEAVLQFLASLGKLGGMDKMAPVLKEMKLSGAEAAGVISALASNVEKVRKEQETANQAFIDGTSITNEYNVQNTTVQAELDKAKKHFKEIRIELGERLLPVMKYMVSTGSLTVKGLVKIVSIFSEYKNAIIFATTSIAGYTIAVNASVIADKAKVLWTGKIVTGLKTLYSVAKAHPWGLLLTIGASLIGLLIDTNKQLSESERLERNLQDIRRRSVSIVNQEAASVKDFLNIARDEKRSKEEREAAIKRLNELSPEYLGSLTLEKINTEQATAAVNAYIDSLLILEDIKQTQQKVSELNDQKNDILKNGPDNGFLEDIEAGAANMLNGFKQSLGLMTDSWADNVLDRYINKGVNQVRDIDKEVALLNAHMEESRQKLIKIEVEKKTEGGAPPPDDKDKKPWTTRLQNAENAYKEELLLLQKSSDALARTENEYQLDALQKELEFQVERLAIIKKYQSSEKDKKHLAELGKLESEAQSAIYNTLKKSEETRLNLIKEYRDRRLNTVNAGEKNILLEQSKLNDSGELTEKDYKNRLLAIEIASLYSRLEIAKDYKNDVAELEFQNGEVKAKALKEAGDNILNLEQQISDKRIKIIRDSANQIQNFSSQFNKMNGLASTDQQLAALESFYKSQLELARKNGLDVTLLTSVYEESKRKIEEKGAKDRATVIQKYELDAAEDIRDLKLKALEEEHKKGLLSEEEYEIAKNKINNEYIQKKIEGSEQYFNAVSSIMSSASSAVQGFQDAEINKVTHKYDKEIKAAKKAGKDTTKLEEEKEEALNQVKRKYADKQFAVSVLQITASTAVAAMEAYKAMAGIPIVGPALGAIAAAAAVASGAAQIAVAKQQRDEAKGLKSGGYSDEYVEGYTKTGNPDDVAGVIPVHKNEFVTNHEGVENPHVRQFLDVFNVAQKNGTIRMLNTTQILEQVRTKSGKYSGGYSDDSVSSSSRYTVSGHIMDEETLRKLFVLLNTNNDLLQSILEKDLIVDSRAIRDGIKKLERMERNVSRG